jgi:hypothetical protein
MSDEPFDLGRLKLTPEQTAELAPLQKKPNLKPRPGLSARRSVGTKFVQLPYERTLAAAGRLGNAPLAVLTEVAYLAFKAHQKPVRLANKALQAAGIDHEAKTRALRRLEAAGLVAVAWRGKGRSPLVSILWE